LTLNDQAKGPKWTPYRGGYALTFTGNKDQTMCFNIKMPHNINRGTNFRAFVNWTGADDGLGEIHWLLTYSGTNPLSFFLYPIAKY
jgi:hypothetical protein